jgi:hypothetical protein
VSRHTRAFLTILAAFAVCPLAASAIVQTGPEPLWLVTFGTDWSDVVRGAAPDGEGGVLIAGQLDYRNLAHPGQGTGFVARYGLDGDRLWLHEFNNPWEDSTSDVISDDRNGAFAAGSTRGSLAAPITSDRDSWVARFDSLGNIEWLEQIGSSFRDYATSVASDGHGGVFVAGNTEGSLGGTNPRPGQLDSWIARYDGGGTRLWIRQTIVGGGRANESVASAAPDGTGGVFLVGRTYHPSCDSAWVARLDGDGNRLWIRQFRPATSCGAPRYESASARSVAPDGAGGVFVTGETNGSLAGPYLGGHGDAWLARYDQDGNRLWLRQFGTPEWDRAQAVAPDNAGGVFVAGGTVGLFGGSSAGKWDAWLMRYDAAGSPMWTYQFGTPELDAAEALAPDGAGGVYMGGYIGGSPGVGAFSSPYSNAFVARFPGNACYPDCDKNGTLDFFDFLCFQNAFLAQDPYADCDGSGALDFFDFLCFQNEFLAGCP